MKEDAISGEELAQNTMSNNKKLKPESLMDGFKPQSSKEWFKKKKLESRGLGDSKTFFGTASSAT